MQTIEKESHVYREESKSEFNTERNVIRGSQCDQNMLSLQNNCDTNRTNECENWYLDDKHNLRPESDKTKVKAEQQKEINSISPQVMDSKIKTNDIPNDCAKSPIEEFRREDKPFQYSHTFTSTPTSNDDDFPDVCIPLSLRL